MNVKAFKYTTPFIVYLLAWLSFTHTGWWCWLALLYAWLLIPLTELVLKPNAANMEAAEEEMAKKDRTYDYILYGIVLLQYPVLIFFLFAMQQPDLSTADIVARVLTMGLLCGTFGINVGHELGHRTNTIEQFMAKALLLTSLYMHFFIEHNKGHHKHVATPDDPSSASYGQSLYAFWIRTITGTYSSAWAIAADDLKKQALPAWHWKNEMLQFQILQLLVIIGIYFTFGGTILLYFIGAAITGILLLETVNYIEHYGLRRKQTADGKYERAMPAHSWNSNHVIGRLMLFELSRHSDHHYLASRKYQILRHHDNAPQMPTGYPGMMILSLFPPAWFYVMHKAIKKYE
jgi:alkane 1-monooxygenase